MHQFVFFTLMLYYNSLTTNGLKSVLPDTFSRIQQDVMWNVSITNEANFGSRFFCATEKPKSYRRANSVHALTPHDMDIIAGMGDSATAGFGAGAKSVLAFPFDYRGLSWSAGGDQDIRSITTLPNILKEYNPALIGYSTGVSFVYSKNLNVARTGMPSSNLVHQAEYLVQKMDQLFENRKIVDSKWKVITMMAGFNDICFECSEKLQYYATNYMQNFKKALEYLSSNVRRAFVNVVLTPDPAELMTKTRGLRCTLSHYVICPCLNTDSTMGTLKQKLFGVYLNQLMDDHNHFNRDDFTVVVQPFLYNVLVPEAYDDYFGLDCSHLNEKGQGLAALKLWNNMLEPVGAKTDWLDWDNIPNFKCTSRETPYFYTSLNSGNILTTNRTC